MLDTIEANLPKKVWGGSFPEMMKLSEYKAMLCVHLKSKIIYGDIENLAQVELWIDLILVSEATLRLVCFWIGGIISDISSSLAPNDISVNN